MDTKFNVLLSQLFIKGFSKAPFLNDEHYNRILYTLRTGRIANVRNPETFNEHILSRKIFNDESGLTIYTDKYGVRDYVESVIGSDYLVGNLGVWSQCEDIDVDKLPEQFVLKATHGSGWNILVRNKAEADWNDITKKLNSALKSNYYYKSREKNYRDIPPRIVCEELLETKDPRGLIDFKVFCFFGTPRFFEVTYQKNGVTHYGTFLADGSRVDIRSRYAQMNDEDILLRKKDVLPLAEKLAARFDFVRVDFYLQDEKIKFSELTFHSGGGIRPIEPISIAYMLGKFFSKEE